MSAQNQEQLNKMMELLQTLERRVKYIEDYLEFRPSTKPVGAHRDAGGVAVSPEVSRSDRSLEFKIGEYWLAQIGTIVLLMGIAFFISYPFKALPPIATSLIGYFSVAGMLGLSVYWKEAYQYLSKILFSGGLAILYFTTLRLHFFSQNPVVSSKAIGLGVLVVVLFVIFGLSIMRRSELLTSLALFLCYATSLISDTNHFALALMTVTSAASCYVFVRYNWIRLMVFSMVALYSSHLLWMLNNPLLGKPMQAIGDHQYNLIYLFLSAACFGAGSLLQQTRFHSDLSEFLQSITNSIGFFAIASLTILTFFETRLSVLNLLLAVFLIASASLSWAYRQSKYASSIYACFGYLALSIAIFAQFDSPQYFIWLGWQSLLVISSALWFRSRIIIVVNSLIYLGIFLAYLQLAPSTDSVNLSYAIVALTSARILNWKKARLELKTDMIRIAYLVSAFIIVLYGLYHAVPSNFVSLSWLGAALFYFAMSQLLNRIKYRWMAILTIFAVVIHVFVIDMARLDAAFRIILFLAIGTVLLGLSLYYTRYRKSTGRLV